MTRRTRHRRRRQRATRPGRRAGEPSSRTRRLGPLPSGSPGWCDGDGHPVHRLRMWISPNAAWASWTSPTPSTQPTPSSLRDLPAARAKD